MKVFKFGGASVKDADSVRNVARVLNFTGEKNVWVVVSAMGKTTNHLEEALKLYFEDKDYRTKIAEIRNQHITTAQELLAENINIQNIINNTFDQLLAFLENNTSTAYDFVYDQVVSTGEIVSTQLISYYLSSQDIECQWIDARKYIKTDSIYREGTVNWSVTCKKLNTLEKDRFYITQGFIGSDDKSFTTTLGREGSDYTGAIIAYCIDAESLTIWKDVPGVMNADPRHFENTTQLYHISYEEAIELAYYGASVIHPKTLQPLQRKNIPLYVKSFENPEKQGTLIGQSDQENTSIPSFIVKQNQNVLRISTKDFAFIEEEVIRDVFLKLADFQLKVNLIQISAISLSLCIEDKFNKLHDAIESLTEDFHVKITTNCSLYTIRHADNESENQIPNKTKTLIRQAGINTVQLVICNS